MKSKELQLSKHRADVLQQIRKYLFVVFAVLIFQNTLWADLTQGTITKTESRCQATGTIKITGAHMNSQYALKGPGTDIQSEYPNSSGIRLFESLPPGVFTIYQFNGSDGITYEQKVTVAGTYEQNWSWKADVTYAPCTGGTPVVKITNFVITLNGTPLTNAQKRAPYVFRISAKDGALNPNGNGLPDYQSVTEFEIPYPAGVGGNYEMQAKDSCGNFKTITINVPDQAPKPALTADFIKFSDNCLGDGDFRITASGGTSPYQLKFVSGPASDPLVGTVLYPYTNGSVFTLKSMQTYVVEVRDECGGTTQKTIVVPEYKEPAISIYGGSGKCTPPTGFPASEGSGMLRIVTQQYGKQPYTVVITSDCGYSATFNNVTSDFNVEDLPRPCNYTITVTDACLKTKTVGQRLIGPEPDSLSVATNAECPDAGSQLIKQLIYIGFGPPYNATYPITFNIKQVVGASEIAVPGFPKTISDYYVRPALNPGTYNFTVADACGATNKGTFVVKEYKNPTLTVDASSRCFAAGQAKLVGINNNPYNTANAPNQYQIIAPSASQVGLYGDPASPAGTALFSNLISKGTYTFSFTDGCKTVTAEATLPEYSQPTWEVASGALCPPQIVGNLQIVNIEPAGKIVTPYYYKIIWTDSPLFGGPIPYPDAVGQTTTTFSNLPAKDANRATATYKILGYDACKNSYQQEGKIGLLPETEIILSKTVACDGEMVDLKARVKTPVVGATYKYYRDGVLVATSTGLYTSISPAIAGTYTAETIINGTSGNCSKTSAVGKDFVVNDIIVSNRSCNNNSTSSTGADDYITFNVEPKGSFITEGFTVSVNNGGTVTPNDVAAGTSGILAFRLQNGSANGTTYTLTFIPKVSSTCIVSSTVSSASCSECIYPTIVTGNDGPKCEGENIQLRVNDIVGATYSWTGPGGYTSLVQNPLLTNVTSAMAGDYIVTVKVGDCSSTGKTTVVINNSPPIEPTVIITQPTCSILKGSIVITTPAPPPGSGLVYEYSINGGAGWFPTGTFNDLLPGTYYVRVRFKGTPNCYKEYSLNPIIIDKPLDPPCITDPVVTQPTCEKPYGTIDIKTCCCSATFMYSINGTDYFDSPIFTNLIPGTYTLYVRSKADPLCISTCTIKPVIGPIPVKPVITEVVITQPTCTVPTGKIVITATGNGIIQYSIDGGLVWQTGNTFNSLLAGNYYIKVRLKDYPDCVYEYQTQPVTINPIPEAPCCLPPLVVQPTCEKPYGTIEINTCCCSTTFVYSIDGVKYYDSPVFTNLTPGTYTLYVKSKANPDCISTCSISPVIDPVPVAPVITGLTITQPTCAIQTGKIVVNTSLAGDFEYSIDGGLVWQASNTFNALLPGNYYIKARLKGHDDCVAVWNGNPVKINPIPVAPCVSAPDVTQPDCVNGFGTIEVIAHCSTTTMEYSINGGDNWSDSPYFTNLTPGNYNIKVRNKNDITCTTIYTGNPVIISAVPLMPVITGLTVTQPTCAVPTGKIVVNTSGTGPYEYSIDGGLVWQASNTFSNLLAGNYYIKVRTKGQPTCVATYVNNPVIINPIPVPPCIGSPVVTQPDCVNGFGTIEVKALCCTSPMEYSSNGGDNYQDSPVFTNLTPGQYNIVVRSKTDPTCITIYTGNPVLILPVPSKPAITGVAITHPDCEQTTGQIVITATITPGGSLLEYSISGGGSWQPGNTFSNLSPGSYAVRVRLAGHPTCYVDAPAYAVINPLPTPPASPVALAVQPTCTVSTGTITVTSPIAPQLKYSINGSDWQKGLTFAGLTPGVYTVHVKDTITKCVSKGSNLTIHTAPVPPAVPAYTLNCTGGPGQGIVTVTSPIGTQYEYKLDNGGYQLSPVFANVSDAQHTVSVRVMGTDCVSATQPFTVNCACANQPTLALSSSSSATCGLTPVTVSGHTFGGSATQVTITHDGQGIITSPTVSTSPFGFTYTPREGDYGNVVTITFTTNNPSGLPCQPAAATYRLTVNVLPSAPELTVKAHPGCIVQTGTIEVLSPIGAQYQYNIDGGTWQDNTLFAGLLPGLHTVKVRNRTTLCVGDGTNATINAVPTAPEVGAPAVTQPTCGHLGTIVVNATDIPGQVMEYSIDGGVKWQFTRTFSNLQPGNYYIRVRLLLSPDCATSYSGNPVVINPVPNAPVMASPTVTQPTCAVPTGTIVVNATGTGTLEYSVNGVTGWQLGNTFSDLLPGSYTVSVRLQATPDCVVQYSGNPVIILDIPVVPNVYAPTVTHPDCSTPTGSITVNADGQSLMEYSINNGGTWQANNKFTGLLPGNYTIRVRLVSSPTCYTNYSGNPVVINPAPTAPVMLMPVVTQPTCAVPSGTIVVNATGGNIGGNSTLEYSINGGSSWQSGNTFSGLLPASYVIQVRLQNFPSCVVEYSGNPVVILDIPNAPNVYAPAVTQPTCEKPTGTIVVRAVGETIMEYSINGGQSWQLDNKFTNVPPGQYLIWVRLQSQPTCVTVYAGNPIVLLEATKCNHPPVAIDDVNNTLVDKPVWGNLLTNDEDPDGDNLIINTTPILNPVHGTVIIQPDGSYKYVPDPGYTGTDVFVYEICDDGDPVLCDQAVVTITIIDPDVLKNDPPVAVNDAYKGKLDEPVQGNAQSNDWDPDNNPDPLSYKVVGPMPLDGTLTMQPNGTFTFEPNPGFTGWVTFDYEVCDLGMPVYCDRATVSIEIMPEVEEKNTTFAHDDSYEAPEDTPIKGNVLTNDKDQEGNTQTVNPVPVTNPRFGTVTLNPDGTFTYVPFVNYNGPDQFIYEVCDNGTPKACDKATVYLLLHPVNDPPVAIDDVNNTLIDTPVPGNVLTNDSDPENDHLTVNPTPVTNPVNGTVVLHPDGSYIYTPKPGFVGVDTYKYQVCDDGIPSRCDTALVTITVINPEQLKNDPPVAVNDAYQGQMDKPVKGNVIPNDWDPDNNLNPNSVVLTGTPPANGTLTLNPDGTFTFEPNPGFHGQVTFTYKICDFGTPAPIEILCDEAKVTIDILPDPLDENVTFGTDDSFNGKEGNPITGNIKKNDTDPEGNQQTVNPVPVTEPQHGKVTIQPNGDMVYVPDSGYVGPDQFIYEVCDDGSPKACDKATVYLTVDPVYNIILTTGDIECEPAGGTYRVFYYSNGKVTSSVGVVGQKWITGIPLGTDVLITAKLGTLTTTETVKGPLTCPEDCIFPDLTAGQSVCMGSTWKVSMTETTGAVLAVSAGTISGNSVINIPLNSDLVITATSGSCVSRITVVRPQSCEDVCSSSFVTFSGPVCSPLNNGTYTVQFELAPGAAIERLSPASVTIVGNTITNIPSGVNLTVRVKQVGCVVKSYTVPYPKCDGCETPQLTIGKLECNPNKGTYSIEYYSTGTVTSSVGAVGTHKITGIPLGIDAVVTSTLNGCTTEETVKALASCPTDCVNPDLTVGQGICDGGGKWSVSYTETSGAAITVNAGTISGNRISNIPVGTDLVVTATTGNCKTEIKVTSPEDCAIICSKPFVSISGPVCTGGEVPSYYVDIVLAPGVTITVSGGTVNSAKTRISNIPSGENLVITAKLQGCVDKVYTVPGERCPEQPELEVVKTANPETFNNVGNVITYTIQVTNTGDVDLRNVNVTDPLTGLNTIIGLLEKDSVRIYTETYVVTASDLAARRVLNTATATAIYDGDEVKDSDNATVPYRNLPPVIECPKPVVTGSTGNCRVNVPNLMAVYTDANSNIVKLTWKLTGSTTDASPQTGINNLYSHEINVGVTTLTYTATDSEGLTGTCSTTITVTDNRVPVIKCPADVVVTANAGSCTATVNLPQPEVTDDCSPLSRIKITSNAPAVFPVGTTRVWWTIIDESGNRMVCSNFVTVGPCAQDDSYTTLKGTPVAGNASVNDSYAPGSTFAKTGEPANGTVTMNPDGTFTYKPNPGFVGTDSFPYKVCMGWPNETLCDDAIVTIKIDPLAPVANDDEKLNNVRGENVTLNILPNDKLSDGTPATPATVTVDIDPGTPGIQTTRTVPGQGVWTYDPATGNVTFDPEPNYTGNPTPITYLLTDKATGKSDDAKVTVTYGDNVAINPALGIVKTSVYDSKTGKITYTYTVTNTGDVTVYDVTISETPSLFTGKGTLPVPVYVSGGSDQGGIATVKDLQPGSTMIWKAEYMVVQADRDAGLVTNQALASGKDPYGKPVTDKSDNDSPLPGNDDPTLTDIPSKPQIGIVKTSVFDQVKGIITYTYTITNTGDVTLYDIAILEELAQFTGTGNLPVPVYRSGGINLGGMAGVRDLTAGSSMVYTAAYKITEEDRESGSVTNQALVSGNDPKGNQVTDKSDNDSPLPGNDDPTITPIPVNAQLGIVKSSVFNASTGVITYTYTVTNTGDVPVYDITVTETKATFTGTGTLPVPVYVSGGSGIGGNILTKDLEPGASMSYTSTYTITDADLAKGSVTNQALASGKDKNGKPVTDKSDHTSPVKGNDKPTVTVITAVPSIGIVKTSVYNAAKNEITYTYTVSNTGKETVFDVAVAETASMFTGTGVLPAPGYVSGGSNLGGNFLLKDLASGESMVFKSVYRVTQSDLDAGSVTNQALASGTDPKGLPVLDKSDHTSPLKGNDNPTITSFGQEPAIGIVKTSVYDASKQTISYTYTVTNTGNVTVYDITVSETAALFTGKGSLPKPVQVSGFSNLGGGSLSDLAVGQSMMFTSTYVILQADIDAGSVTNQALASGKDPKGNPVTDKSDHTTPARGNDNPTITVIKANAALTVTKTQDKGTYSKAGEVISYTIVVKNTGNVTLSDVKLDDPLTGLKQDIGKLETGKEVTLTTKYTVKQADVDNGSITNKALVTSKDPSGKEVPGEGSVTATAVKQPGLKIEKQSSLSGREAEVGEIITYTLKVTNTGNTTLTDVAVTDTLTKFSVKTGTMQPGDIKVYTTTYTVTMIDEMKGRVINYAGVTGNIPGGGKLDNTASVTDRVALCELFIPEIFSPNGDGIQDYFRIKCIEKYPDARIIVFNRWGNKVYTREHYGNMSIWGTADAWWDGRSDNKWDLGKEILPAGTYYYILYLNDREGTRKQGYLYLNSDMIK